MSWQRCNEIIDSLEKKVSDGSITLNDLLVNDTINNALAAQLPKISGFIAKNISEVIEYALGLRALPKDLKNKKCLDVINSHNIQINQKLQKDPEIVNLLCSAISKDINYVYYVKILKNSIDSGDFLSNIKEPEQFFVSLIDHVNIKCVMQFLIELCSRSSTQSAKWLSKVNADKILLNKLDSDEQTVVSCLQLINAILRNKDAQELSLKISVLDNFKKVFNTAIDAPTVDVAMLSFKVLIMMVNVSDDSKVGDAPSQLELIIDELMQCSERLCEFVQRDSDFFSDKFSAIELIVGIVENKDTLEDCIVSVAKQLFEMFFSQPTNTFLQRAFLNLFTSMIKSKSGCNDFLVENKILEKLMEEHNNITPVSRIYHGFIMTMAKEINDNIDKESFPTPEGWKEFIKTVVIPTFKQYNTNYGGRIPKTLLDTLGDGQNFVDDNDDDEDGFEDVDSSDDAKEEEEEERE